MNLENTVAAISTPMGKGGIHVIRISGKDAHSILKKIVVKQEFLPRVLTLTRLKKPLRDTVLAAAFYAPDSYTGEDVAEVQCHGSAQIAAAVLKAAINSGARAAEAGEFTLRAYLNNKLTLDEAEGVADLINAQTQAQISAAYALSAGAVKAKIRDMQQTVSELNARCLAAIDYPDEDIEDITREQVKKGLTALKEKAEELVKTYDGGRIIKEGVRLAIVGRTNSGKSALLNALTGYERAIVSDVEGTTRDTVEEAFEYKGLKFLITDTAGIRKTADRVEQLGIERSIAALKSSDLVLAVSEIGEGFGLDLYGKPYLAVKTKLDLYEGFSEQSGEVAVSALKGKRIEALKEEIYKRTAQSVEQGGEAFINARHYAALTAALGYIDNALENADAVTVDCITSDLSLAAEELGKITGESAAESVIAEIFSKFCVGK